MEGMRDLLRGSLRRSLRSMAEVDRLSAAWPVVCGIAMAAQGEVIGYYDGVVEVIVTEDGWLQQMLSMQGQIASELGRIAGVRVTAIHFEKKRFYVRPRA